MHSHDGDPALDQRLGARVRGGRDRGRGPGRRASERGRRAARRPGSGADRDPARAQGPLRRRGKATHRIEPPPRGRADGGLRRLEAAGRCGHGAARPSAHARVRRRRHDGSGRQPVGPRALRRWLERRLGGGAGGLHGSCRHRHRDRGIAPDPVRLLRHLGDQADAWPGLDGGSRAARLEPRPRRPDGAHARRLPIAAGGDGRPGSGSCRERSPRACSCVAARSTSRGPLAGVRLGVSPRVGGSRARRRRGARASSSRSRRAVASVQCSSSRRPPRADRRRATTSSTS